MDLLNNKSESAWQRKVTKFGMRWTTREEWINERFHPHWDTDFPATTWQWATPTELAKAVMRARRERAND